MNLRRFVFRSHTARLHVLAALLLASGGSRLSAQSSDVTTQREILTGVPPYVQEVIRTVWTSPVSRGKVLAGCGPVAGMMLLAYYDRRFGFDRLVPTAWEGEEACPSDFANRLYDEMNTTPWVLSKPPHQAFTLPADFRHGLRSYIRDRGYDCEVKTLGTSSLGVTLDDVFAKSVQLIESGKPHVLLYDEGKSILPNHFAVVVGFDRRPGRKRLIVNKGWGEDFEVVDCGDDAIRPARLYWLKMLSSPDSAGDAHRIGPPGNYTFTEESPLRLEPCIRNAAGSSLFDWRSADSTVFFRVVDKKWALSRNCWY